MIRWVGTKAPRPRSKLNGVELLSVSTPRGAGQPFSPGAGFPDIEAVTVFTSGGASARIVSSGSDLSTVAPGIVTLPSAGPAAGSKQTGRESAPAAPATAMYPYVPSPRNATSLPAPGNPTLRSASTLEKM